MQIKNILQFAKMTGTGNDFIVFDNRERLFTGNEKEFFQKLCRRGFSIGADGVLLLEKGRRASLSMRYYNSDGFEAPMCGNGLRCLAYYAYVEGLMDRPEFSFEASDGVHDVEIHENIVAVSMCDPKAYNGSPGLLSAPGLEEGGFVDTGVPHYVLFTGKLAGLDVNRIAPQYRSHKFFDEGVNVNFVEIKGGNHIEVRTFERGVEGETLSCGTGCVASALIAWKKHGLKQPVKTSTRGGDLIVSFDDNMRSVRLTAEVELIYRGTLVKP